MTIIDTSAIRDGKYILQSTNTESHFHNDPKLVEQPNASTDLFIGALVYLDHTGIYKLALATLVDTSYVMGVVYEFLGTDKFYLKMSEGHLYYRHPLPPEWFSQSFGQVEEMAPLYDKVPAILGYPLYLSDSEPGRMQPYPPLSGTNIRLMGYRTESGFYFKPEPYCDTGCLGNPPTSPPAPLKNPNQDMGNFTLESTFPKAVFVWMYNSPISGADFGSWANGSYILTRSDLLPVDSDQFKISDYKWFISNRIPTEIEGEFGRIILTIDNPINTISVAVEYESPSLSNQYSWSLIQEAAIGYKGFLNSVKENNFGPTYNHGDVFIKSWLYI